MTTTELRSDLGTRDTLLKLLWGGFTASLIMYLALSFVMAKVSRDSGSEPRDLGALGQIFITVASGSAVVSMVLHRMRLSLRKLELRYSAEGEALLVRSLPLYIACWALNDAVCIVGLLWTILARDPSLLYPFFAVSLIMQVAMFPWAGHVVRRLSAAPAP